uniref:Uncharacterized protein n=1 Tax=Rhizophagus irregularis (strain DAOM 181602 / DAOM 197198 / MUCL 43194) TaxID=747089 RepID=U9TVI0_RHIID
MGIMGNAAMVHVDNMVHVEDMLVTNNAWVGDFLREAKKIFMNQEFFELLYPFKKQKENLFLL